MFELYNDFKRVDSFLISHICSQMKFIMNEIWVVATFISALKSCFIRDPRQLVRY